MITAADLEQQRNYIYGELEEILPKCNFVLHHKVHQISAMFQIGIDVNKVKGYCHGYNTFWERNLLKDKQTAPPVEDILALTDEIQVLQRERNFSYAVNRFLNSSAKYCPSKDSLHQNILSQCSHALNNPGTMLVLGIGKAPTFAFIKSLPQLHFIWHELRFYCDLEGRAHWFDANVGWFVSRVSEPTMADLGAFLDKILKLMQYDEHKLFVRFDSYNLEKPSYRMSKFISRCRKPPILMSGM